jgi:anaerobic dimethyl sulfoxide reductase subunit B (iron-sulfur subunit)
MQMCDFCLDRLVAGDRPACVAVCPMEALDAGPLHELEKKYGQGRSAEGFNYDDEMKPSIIFKPKSGPAQTAT